MLKKQTIVWLEVQSPVVMDEANKALPEGFEVIYPKSRTDREEHTRLIAQADYLITQGIVVDADQLGQASHLKMIQKFGIGVDKIDIEAAQKRNIPVYITAGANAIAVAELAVGLMIAANRCLSYVDRAVRAGGWPKAEMRAQCYMLHGKTIGLIGIGNIAKEVARRLSGFGVGEILYYDVAPLSPEREQELHARYAPLDELMAAADVVSIHVPLCEGTKGLIDQRRIAMMKPTAILVNTSRGHIVDEAALVEALWNKKIRGAGLDAYDEEPVSPENPLLLLDNVVLTCHYGGSVIDNVLPRAQHAYGNIEKFAKGEEIDPRDVVVPKRPQ